MVRCWPKASNEKALWNNVVRNLQKNSKYWASRKTPKVGRRSKQLLQVTQREQSGRRFYKHFRTRELKRIREYAAVHLSAPIALSHKHAHIYCILLSERGVLLGNQRRRAADSCKTHTRPAGFSRLWTLRCGRGGARWLLGRVALAAAANSLGRWDARPSGPPKAILSRAPRRRLKIAAPQLPLIGYCPAVCVFAERQWRNWDFRVGHSIVLDQTGRPTQRLLVSVTHLGFVVVCEMDGKVTKALAFLLLQFA
jgi:hypothetical protein